MAEYQKTALPNAQADWAYFLDIDGTLVDIAEAPDAIHVDRGLLDLIADLHRSCDGAVALISGRTLRDIDGRLDGVRIPIAGQHGLERRDGQGRHHTHPAAPEAKRYIHERVERFIVRHPGLLLEDKGLTLALHYRQAPELGEEVHALMQRLVDEAGAGLSLQEGKCVVEVKPVGFDKGTVVDEFMSEAPFRGRRPVFVGDDVTDEYGFRVVNRMDGISIKVGPGRTEARWRVDDVAAARNWLRGAFDRIKEESHG